AMSIRLIARDLYRLQKEVETLERALMEAPVDKRPDLEEQLRKLMAERTRMERMLEGAKEPPTYRKPK
ncbi:MAG: hypothetical protein MUO52_01130, partial [Desulfobacterales bacterium]|nr:hypothetical protein [Desulfobacterales bacterium]